MRVVILGGTGNFGARIVRALHGDTKVSLIAAGRRANSVPGATGVPTVALDFQSPTFAARLRNLAPDVVVHCVGPFQGQDYRVAEAAIAADAHYVDLADGRDFVLGFASALQERAMKQGRLVITGASTLPALSSAVVDHVIRSLRAIESIEVTIAPGQLAARGTATLAAVFSYLGRPLLVWRDNRWRREWGWMDVRGVDLDIGGRWGAVCDVSDLSLFPERYPGVRDVRFHAALEFKLQHVALWLLGGVRRMGLPFPVDQWAIRLNRLASMFDPLAGAWGGMRVSVVGESVAGGRVRHTWQLRVPALDGPEIPCMAAILLIRQMAAGQIRTPGAYPCMGMLTLEDFAPQFDRWGIRTRIDESAP